MFMSDVVQYVILLRVQMIWAESKEVILSFSWIQIDCAAHSNSFTCLGGSVVPGMVSNEQGHSLAWLSSCMILQA